MSGFYRIVEWDRHYESYESKRKLSKNPSWLPIPNELAGDGYCTIMAEADGAAIYGAFVAVLLVAQRCTPRGDLITKGRPHTSASLSRITRIPTEIIDRMLSICTSEEVGWIEVADFDGSMAISAKSRPPAADFRPPAAKSRPPAAEMRPTRQDNTGQEKTDNRAGHGSPGKEEDRQLAFVLGGQAISVDFWRWVLDHTGNDPMLAGKCFFRARAAKSIRAYILKGVKDGYIFNPSVEEGNDPKYAREFVETVILKQAPIITESRGGGPKRLSSLEA